MRKIFILILIAFALNLNAQSFSINLDHETYSDTLGSEIIFEFEVTNISSSDLSLYILRTQNELPDNWSSSLCFDYCFAPHLDSIVTNSSYGSSAIAADESRTFSVHVFPNENEGNASIGIKVANLDNPSESEDFQLTATGTITSVKKTARSNSFKLHQNYPNPFNPSTNISFELNEGSKVKLNVYDVLGNEISTLTNKYYSKGFYNIEFNAELIPSGIYFYRIQTKAGIQVKKMIVGK